MRQRYIRGASASRLRRSNRSGISFDRSNSIHLRARGHITATRTWIHALIEPGHHALDFRARLGPVSGSRGKLPSPSSHRTGLVGLTSGSSGRQGRRQSSHVCRRRPRGPQLFQRKRQLHWSGDAVHGAVLVLQREESVVREVPLVESVVHWAAVTERPQGCAPLVDDPPCGAGSDASAALRFRSVRYCIVRLLPDAPSRDLRSNRRPCLVDGGFPPSGPQEDLTDYMSHLVVLCSCRAHPGSRYARPAGAGWRP
jgi:hypothetical protein